KAGTTQGGHAFRHVKKYEEERISKEDDRIQEIFAFIRVNYRQNITLSDLAEQLYLSTTYVSRYIKQKCNINFMELLNQVRLTHAMEDLMYTDDSILKIALDNGFASVAAYNKTFKEAYQTTPSEYRRQRRMEKGKNREEARQKKRQIEQRVEEYLQKNPFDISDDTNTMELTITADLDKIMDIRWDGYCCKMINAGSASILLDGGLQNQLLELKETLGIQYVRFWDIYAPNMYLDLHAEEGEQNYSRINGVIDFLVRNQLKPYIDLGFKPIRILRNAQTAIREEERSGGFASGEEAERFYRNLISFFISRYGMEEVSTWYFEVWEDNAIRFENDEGYTYAGMQAESHKAYFKQFSLIAGSIRSVLPEAKIGGGGFPIRLYGENGFAQILTVWKQEEEKPDFLSLNCFPYIMEYDHGKYYEKRNTDMDFVGHNIDAAKKALALAEFPEVELHVSEYSFSLSNRNMINDSCLVGGYLVQNAVSCLGKARFMGYWLFTDIYTEAKDTRGPLFGGCGLLTKTGVPKPSCYALDFLNRLYEDVLCISPNYIVTRSKRGSVRIVCHNMKKLNFQYYMTPEDEIRIQEIPGMLENREFLTIHIRLEHMRDGNYKIRKNQLNRLYGSVQARWQDLNMEKDLSMHELTYLKTISIPSSKVQVETVQDGILSFETLLEPNEIQYLYISL
ncbi:MAG: helix-turn-helix domain-containing protein, partial [Eubacteriales bacterium]|nr:helix-turn-helix domain-containing protein [Eubacteriales bacterium]